MKFISLIKIALLFCLLVLVQTTNAQENLDIFEVARKGTYEQAKEILKANPKAFTILNEDGYSPLILACYRGNNEVAKLLIDNKCNINGTSKMGTPLMAAIFKNNTEIAKYLIKNNADLSVEDANGTSALIYATNAQNYEIVSLLTNAGADYNKKDKRGKSALDYAILLNDDKLIETLKNKKL